MSSPPLPRSPERQTHASSTGLATGTAAALAYLGWWITGLVLWTVERDDTVVRFHAAQSCVALGAVSLAVLLTGSLTLASLSYLPAAFEPLVFVTAGLALGGGVLCAVSAWRAGAGHRWRLPLASRAADWLVGAGEVPR